MGNVAASPLPPRGSPPPQRGGQNQKRPINGQGGYITPAASGIPSASKRGAKSEVAQKWARWLRHPCRLGDPHRLRAGGFGMTPWCDDLVCSWRRLLADRHSLPFPWTLSLHRRWCPSASHHPLTFLFLLALTFPLPSPFPSLGLSLCRPTCPSASPHSFPSLSLGRLCQRSPRTCPVSLLCVESTQRKANAFAVVRAGGGAKSEVAHKWARWLRHPCRLGDPHRFRAGGKIRSGP